MKRIFWILFTPALLISIFFWAFQNFVAPSLVKLAVEKIESLTKEQGPVEVKIKTAELLYLPLGVRAQQVLIKPKGQLSKALSDIEVESIEARLGMFALLTGRLKVALVEIQTPQAQLNISNEEKSSSAFKMPQNIDWVPLLKKLQEIPFEQIRIRNLNFLIKEKKTQATLSLYPTDIQILQLTDLLQLKVIIPKAIAAWDSKERLKTKFEFATIVTPQVVRIQRLNLSNEAIDFQLSGELKSQKKKKNPHAEVLWTGSVNLDQLHEALKLVLPEIKWPEFDGQFKAKGSWSPRLDDFLHADFELQTEGIKVASFSIGDAQVKGSLENTKIKLDNLKAQHPAGTVIVRDTVLSLESDFPVSLQIQVPDLDLQKLFQSLNLKQIPVEASIHAEAPCEGRLKPLQFTCEVKGSASALQVKTSRQMDGFEIVKVAKISAQGKTQIDLEKISFEAIMGMGQSKGEGKGTVEYKKGFDISFKVPELHWDEVENLSSLKLRGVSQIQGQTKGNTEAAVLELSAKSENQSLADFYLGQTQMNLKYQAGHLAIEKAQGQIDQTQYNADLDINLSESLIKGHLQFPKARLQDVRRMLIDAIPIPIQLEGNGTAQATFDGPLNFWKLNTELTGQFQQVNIATESFKDLNIQISSQNGNYELKQVQARRNQTLLSVSGFLQNDKSLSIDANLQNFLLEESDFVSRLKWPLNGRLNSQMKLTGNIADPNLNLSGQFTDLLLEDTEVANSNFRLGIENKNLTFEGIFLGNQIQTALNYPLGDRNRGMRLRVKTQNWDFTPWLSLINSGVLTQDASGNLTSEVELVSENGEISGLSGNIKIPKLALTKQDLTLQNTKPLSISVSSGVFDIQNFSLYSSNGKVELMGENILPQSLNLQLIVDSDLKLAQLFIPLFEEISGAIQVRSTISGSWDRPQLIGTLKVHDGYLRIKNFPHAFEKLKVDTTFSQSRILFNEIRATLGGGDIRGEGGLQIQGPQDIPTLIRLKGRGVTLNIPDKVKTRGEMDLTFSGRWFPFTLAGTYRIASTNFEMNFSGGKTAKEVKQNIYLPQTVKEKIADPLNFDLQLLFDKPIQIKNNLLEAQATGQITLKGSPTLPVLKGQIVGLKGSKLFFKDKPFDIQSANIQFQNPAEINPDLFISAQTRVEEYDVFLLVQGSAKDPSVRLSSQPPLAENDIISLLALGVTSARLATVDSRGQQEQTSYEVFAAAFQSTGLTQKVQSATGFNVQLSNSFDTTRNISIPKFTISRKLNQRTNARIAFPVTGDQRTPEGRLQYMINDNVFVNGSYETRKFDLGTTTIINREVPSILGLDLEFKREFK